MSRSRLLGCVSLCTLAFLSSAFAQTTVLPPINVEGTSTEAGTAPDQVPVTPTTSGPVQGYRALTAGSATKTDTPIERVPQSIQVVPRTVIDAQSALSVSEAVRNVSNTQPVDTRIVGNTDLWQLRIRGFPAEQWTDGLVNVYATGNRDGLANVERIEVLKGPNAILYGGGTGAPIGGTVNVVSKMPTDMRSYEFGGTFGSFNTWTPYFDVNQPLNDSKTALFRITGEYSKSKNFTEVLDAKSYSINPTFTLTDRSDTSLTIQAFMSRFQQQAYPGLPVYGTILGDYRVRRDLFFGIPSIEPSYSKTQGVTVTFDHEFTRIWSANIKARWSQSEFNQVSQASFFDATGTGGTPFAAPSTFDVNNLRVFQQQREFTINPTLKAKFDTGPSQNTLLLGADYSRVKDSGYMKGDFVGFVDLNNPVFNIPYADPVGAFFNFQNDYITKGAYAQLQSTLYDRVHLLGGARLASIDISYTENALTPPATFITDETKVLPRAGIVVDLVKGLSVYASYSEGMKWAGFTQAVSRPKPELSSQVDAGIKLNIDNKLTGTLAVFQIDRENVPVTIAVGVAGLSQQRSRGFETDLVYQPNRNWSFLGSYGFADAVFAEPFLSGTTPIPAGNKIPMVSAHSGRLWAEYKFDASSLPGWSVGAGIFAASSQYVDPANLWKTSGYYTVDAKIGYENDKFRAALTVKNLTGEEYYTPYAWLGGQVAPGAPRSIYGQVAYKFN
jgi:iron complex outermembrane receptor protein